MMLLNIILSDEGDELRINGSYPYSRYFSYQTYVVPDFLPKVRHHCAF